MKEVKFDLDELKKQSYLTLTEASFVARQDRKEVLCWIKTGKIKGYQLCKYGSYKVNTKSLFKFLDSLEHECRAV